MKIITVCGSLKFVKEMMEITEKMELQGNCMLVPIYNPSKASKDDFTEEETIMLDKMHKERIKLSEVLNNFILLEDNILDKYTYELKKIYSFIKGDFINDIDREFLYIFKKLKLIDETDKVYARK